MTSTVAVRPSIATTAALLVEADGDVDEDETPQPAIVPAIVPRRSARNNWYEVTAYRPVQLIFLTHMFRTETFVVASISMPNRPG